MKNILVPTDYSSYADNAVRHAIGIAQKINANIHLFHALEIPSFSAIGGQMIWPLTNFSEMQDDSDEDLLKYIETLKNDATLCSPFFPNITYSSEIGLVKQIIDKLSQAQHFDLIVMGLSGAGKIDHFFLGSNSRQIIEKTKIPVLLVPKQSPYQPFQKIAFATDLCESDLNSIYAVTRLFSLFAPEILLVHVNNQVSNLNDPNTAANIFLNHVTGKLNYAKIYYRPIQANHVQEGLKWLAENGQINVLAMIHRHSSLFSKILKGSETQKIATVIHLPLLVMPEDETPIGW